MLKIALILLYVSEDGHWKILMIQQREDNIDRSVWIIYWDRQVYSYTSGIIKQREHNIKEV